MRLLLDTHFVIWLVDEPSQLRLAESAALVRDELRARDLGNVDLGNSPQMARTVSFWEEQTEYIA